MVVFVYKLSGCRFESGCSHLKFRFRACFEQGVPWHSGKYRVCIHSETCRWHDKKIQSNALYRKVLTTQLKHWRRPVWLNGWVFVYELSGCGFECSCSHLTLKWLGRVGRGGEGVNLPPPPPVVFQKMLLLQRWWNPGFLWL